MRLLEEKPPKVGLVGKKLRSKIEDAFDVNFDVAEIKIDTIEEFTENLYKPFKDNANVYYRGERINSSSRRLVPTILRQGNMRFADNDTNVSKIDGNFLYNYYSSHKSFLSVYNTVYGSACVHNLYNMTAFAQHYLDVSPFIDFTKSLYVALSFAIKGRAEVKDDIVIYTAFDIGDDDTTDNVDEVNSWLENYNVNIVNLNFSEEMHKQFLELQKTGINPSKLIQKKLKQLEEIYYGMLPSAKLIDIPTNDLMKYQQGVFLLLNNFSLIGSKYLTKSVRQSFIINKYVINQNICAELRAILLNEAPEYRYECLLNISKAVRGDFLSEHSKK